MGLTPFYSTLNELEHHFSNIEGTHTCLLGVLAENYFSTSDGETLGDECLCHKELKSGFRILIA